MRRNEMGVTLSGPVIIPKIYNGQEQDVFFASYEPKRRRDENAQWATSRPKRNATAIFRNSWVKPRIHQPSAVPAGGLCG